MPDEDKLPDSGQQQTGLMFLAENHSLVYTDMLDTNTVNHSCQFKLVINCAVKLRIMKPLVESVEIS